MRKYGNFAFVVMMVLVTALMVMLSYGVSWLLLPDLLLLLLLSLQVQGVVRIRWLLVLPFTLFADVTAGVSLGFTGVYYALTFFALLPVGRVWLLVSQMTRLVIVLFASLALVLLKWFLLYVLVGDAAVPGWWWSVFAQALIWPVVQWLVWQRAPKRRGSAHE
ncbi:hypothetical protein L0B52_08110 [Suttonella sp. R2A3]|uniref:hypothetical protein n=1 Tax=Suttonella sp. R2A3 TaxID=2908648 RepID=UPI001F2E4554|nr:hypothetical protein [Suttonella sp. R2A3]UJF24292.1 hypothetical protein L0B52_08110 [Suttonella sp. R2A3]